MKKLQWAVELGAVLALSLPLLFLPLKAGEYLGLAAHALWGSRRNIAIENVRQAIASGSLPSTLRPEDVVRGFFRHLGRSILELVKISCGFGSRITSTAEIRGAEHYHQAKAAGRGVIFLTGHCGNWELVAILSSVHLEPFSVVARRQNNPYINRLVELVRGKFGNAVIYKKGALKNIMLSLKQNGAIGILMDQAVTPEEGYIIDFLGRPAWTMKVPALIGRKTGAAILPSFIHREGNCHIVTIHAPVVLSGGIDNEQAIMQDTKRLTVFVEDYIRAHPEQWLWIHRRWKRAGKEQI